MQGKVTLEEHIAIEETASNFGTPFPDRVWQELKSRLVDVQDRRLKLMDQYGIETMLLSLNAPAVQGIPDPGQAAEVARKAPTIILSLASPQALASTVAAIAKARGEDPLATLYDLMLERNASAMLMLPLYNYADGNHDAIREMMLHPAGVLGLSDGGAHCGMICDASYPTFLLTHWARDRHRGEKLSLEYVIRKQSRDTAHLFGLTDRGTIEPGKKADINVIDMDKLTLHPAAMAYDLPAGGHRILQGASGYTATIVSGTVTRRDDVDTGARPGRLVRGAR